jgi:hypothetical protein
VWRFAGFGRHRERVRIRGARSEILLVLALNGKRPLYVGCVCLHMHNRLVGAKLMHVLSALSERTVTAVSNDSTAHRWLHTGRASYAAIDRRQTTRGRRPRRPAARQPCRAMRVAVPSGLEHDAVDHSSKWTSTSVLGRSSALAPLLALDYTGTDHMPRCHTQASPQSGTALYSRVRRLVVSLCVAAPSQAGLCQVVIRSGLSLHYHALVVHRAQKYSQQSWFFCLHES